jgi:hypothetical protein
MGAAPSWEKGDAYEDFVTGRVLAARATEEDRRSISEKVEEYAKEYSLTGGEKDYLSLYLTAESVIGRKRAEGTPDERDLKAYYDAHRNEYLSEKEKRYVKYLVMRYSKKDKRGSVAMVSELQREAGKGKALEEIVRSRAGTISLKRADLDELPGWIREKILVLKDGEISSIFTEDQFLLLQMQVKAPVYRRYEDVREEIRKKLSPGNEGTVELEQWLADLRKEAVEIR